jgi:hypothetical protein
LILWFACRDDENSDRKDGGTRARVEARAALEQVEELGEELGE